MTRVIYFMVAIGAFAGCDRDGLLSAGDRDMALAPADLTFIFPPVPDQGALCVQVNACGDCNPTCTLESHGSPLPLQSDPNKDPDESDTNLARQSNGTLGLGVTTFSTTSAWTANTDDWQRGTVSKWDTSKLREVARYFTVTCNSLPDGNANACDGKNGCCAKDSMPQYLNRKAKMPSGPYQQVERTHINYPSRTAIDLDGSMWVSNRALYQQGAQSSVTKIAGESAACIDRNKNGKIDTSNDVNGDGIIETDCNGDGMPDDLASVKALPCTNGHAQEFYGLDDECVLLTTNTDSLDMWGRPLALGAGAIPGGPSDVWAGLFNNHHVYRINGTTGLTEDDTTLPCTPYGFAIDVNGIGWAANLGPAGCYWDTRNPQNVGTIRTTQGQSSYGIGLDRDQNVWFGGTAARYTPNRKGNFMDLGNGFWTVFSGISGAGVAVDSRTPKTYFAYFAGQQLYQVPASTIPVPNGMDVTIPANGFPSVPIFGGGGKGVDIAYDNNVMVTSQGTAGIQRVNVDINGKMAAPDLQSPPIGNNTKCPSGDFCANSDHGQMNPYTYSDFTGYGLRNFTRPSGQYLFVQKGCSAGVTKWLTLSWDVTTPAMTSIGVRVRSGATEVPDNSWGQWSAPLVANPTNLGVALPPAAQGGFLQIEFDLATSDLNASPLLKDFNVQLECD